MRPDRLQNLRDAQRVAAKTFLSFPVAIAALGSGFAGFTNPVI